MAQPVMDTLSYEKNMEPAKREMAITEILVILNRFNARQRETILEDVKSFYVMQCRAGASIKDVARMGR